MKHTFQVGDRVMGKGRYMMSMANDNEPGTVAEVKHHGVEVAMDRRELNRDKGVWFLAFDEVSHDTDFQVGDWVRYEAVKPYTKGYDTEDGKVGQITHLGREFATINGELNDERFISNLVKIQPPQEAPMQERQEDAIERGIQEKIRLLERQVEKAKCCLETYRDIKRFINKEDHYGKA